MTTDILSEEQITELRDQLEEKRQQILELYAKDLRAGKEAAQEETDDIVDRANSAYNRELMFSLSDVERQQLVLIEQAIERLNNGVYGYCLHSGSPLALARLQAVPWARFSVQVQEKLEKGLLTEEDLNLD